MVGPVGSAAQQITSNLTKLKSPAGAQGTNIETDLDGNLDQAENSNTRTADTSANLSSRVSSGLVRLKKASIDGFSESVSQNVAQNGVEVELSKKAKQLLKSS